MAIAILAPAHPVVRNQCQDPDRRLAGGPDGVTSELLEDLDEETFIRVMAPLTYWLHERWPGRTASCEAWTSMASSI